MALSGLSVFKTALKDMFANMRTNPPSTIEDAVLAEEQFCNDLANMIDVFVRTAIVKVNSGIPIHIADLTVPGLSVPGLSVGVPSVPYTGTTGGGTTGGGNVGGAAETNAEGVGHLE
jgi:hypothetical protein